MLLINYIEMEVQGGPCILHNSLWTVADTEIDGVAATQILRSSPLCCTVSLKWFDEESPD